MILTKQIHNNNIHLVIRYLRKQKGYKQGEFAEKLGVTQKHYNSIEMGHVKPNWNMLIKIIESMDARIMIVQENEINEIAKF